MARGAHVLPDLLVPGLRLVICGSAAGAVSAARGAYYAGPGNKFWRVLAEIGLTPHLMEPHEFRALVNFGIGLTDLVKTASGSDASLPRAANALPGSAPRSAHARFSASLSSGAGFITSARGPPQTRAVLSLSPVTNRPSGENARQ